MRELIITLFCLFPITQAYSKGGKENWQKHPIITVDAIEVNFKCHKKVITINNQNIVTYEPGFAQLIFWKWSHYDFDWYGKSENRPPRMGWVSHDYKMYELARDENNKYLIDIDINISKITVPTKNHNDGYWYVTVRENKNDYYQIRSKTYIGTNVTESGIRATFTIYDPETIDKNFRKNNDKQEYLSPDEQVNYIRQSRSKK